jgi:hypothetical protein
MVETWTSLEAHGAAARNIPPDAIAEYMKLVASPPSGSYFSPL